MEYILGFGSAHKALKAEDILKKASIPLKLLPAPREAGFNCGLVICLAEVNLNAALAALKSSSLKIKSFYKKEGDVYVKV
ncbi:MAG: DUF3343 domain-containing protein [Deltaproteobacteria bacterium]|nr:DUF3343 domain-containing protein [Deltaproteobacteria bacterium]